MPAPRDPAPAFAHPLAVDALPATGATLTLAPDAAARAALAQSLGLDGIEDLSADLTLAPAARDNWHVTGEIRARIRPVCVLTLEPFAQEISAPVDVVFAPPDVAAEEAPARAQERAKERTKEDAADDDEPQVDPPDEIVDGMIDLGAVVAEFLALALDPYPRKPGAVFAYVDEAAGDASPFAALKALREPPKP